MKRIGISLILFACAAVFGDRRGQLMNQRRSGAGCTNEVTPTPAPPGSPLFWYPAGWGQYSDTGGCVRALSQGDKVVRWNDASGHAYDVFNPSPASTVGLLNVNVLGGYPSYGTTNAFAKLQIPAALTLDLSTGLTVFAVAQLTSNNIGAVFSIESPIAIHVFRAANSGSTNKVIQYLVNLTAAATNSWTNMVAAVMERDEGSDAITIGSLHQPLASRLNGSGVRLGNRSDYLFGVGNTVTGGSSGWQGHLLEEVGYSYAMTQVEVDAVFSYLALKFSLP